MNKHEQTWFHWEEKPATDCIKTWHHILNVAHSWTINTHSYDDSSRMRILTNQIPGFPNLLFLTYFSKWPFFSKIVFKIKIRKLKIRKGKKLKLNLTICDDVIACKWIRRCVRGRANIVRCWSHRLNIQKIKKL